MSGAGGARAILQTLVDGGVDVCFTHPGTAEMHLLAGLDEVPRMRGILCLFEGVATGAADGYARMADRPASTLLHLGPGLANGMANLHNARRAGSPVVNLVGDHATDHKRYDAPLESDIDSMAGTVSRWVHRSTSAAGAGPDTAMAIAQAGSTATATGGVATLILPADVCWSSGGVVAPVPASPALQIDVEAVEQAAKALRDGQQAVLLLGGVTLRREGLAAAARIAAATGCTLLSENRPARIERGAGLPRVERLPTLAEMAAAQLRDVRHLVLAGARPPVSSFAYPGSPSDLVARGCTTYDIGGTAAALGALADLIAPGVAAGPTAPLSRPDLPEGPLNPATVSAVVGALLPEGAIVVDEAVTSGLWLAGATAGCPPHDWLTLTGGAIGLGMPMATGAAVARPDRPVLNLQADGSAMYTLQALWTQAREGLNVTTVVLNNASYAILHQELQRMQASAEASPAGPRSKALFDLPGLNFVALSRGMGVPASRATTAEELTTALRTALSEPGPHLIEAIVGR
jgi:acetolactate synthase-1/2/3 large subunit